MRHLFSGIAILSLSVLCACGPSAEPTNTNATKTPANANANANTNTASTSSTGAAGNSITVESKNGAYPADLKFDKIGWATAEYGLGGDNEKVLFINLANTDLKEMKGVELSKHKLADGQGMLRLEVTRTDGPVTTGTYKPAASSATDMRVLPTINVANGTGVSFNASKSEGTLEITELTKDKVVGKYDIKDDFSHVSGTFDAKIITPVAEKK